MNLKLTSIPKLIFQNVEVVNETCYNSKMTSAGTIFQINLHELLESVWISILRLVLTFPVTLLQYQVKT